MAISNLDKDDLIIVTSTFVVADILEYLEMKN